MSETETETTQEEPVVEAPPDADEPETAPEPEEESGGSEEAGDGSEESLPGGPDAPAEESPEEIPPLHEQGQETEVPDTPSGLALAEVGPPPDTEDSEELLAHGEDYLAAKLEHRHG